MTGSHTAPPCRAPGAGSGRAVRPACPSARLGDGRAHPHRLVRDQAASVSQVCCASRSWSVADRLGASAASLRASRTRTRSSGSPASSSLACAGAAGFSASAARTVTDGSSARSSSTAGSVAAGAQANARGLVRGGHPAMLRRVPAGVLRVGRCTMLTGSPRANAPVAAAGSLDLVHRVVGAAQQAVDRFAAAGAARVAMPIDMVGVGAPSSPAIARRSSGTCDAEPFGAFGRRHVVGAVQPQRELVAASRATRSVGRTVIAQQGGGAQQHLVARPHGRGGRSPA